LLSTVCLLFDFWLNILTTKTYMIIKIIQLYNIMQTIRRRHFKYSTLRLVFTFLGEKIFAVLNYFSFLQLYICSFVTPGLYSPISGTKDSKHAYINTYCPLNKLTSCALSIVYAPTNDSITWDCLDIYYKRWANGSDEDENLRLQSHPPVT